MEAFDPATVYSSIDTGGRYAYGNQPVVAEWNLARLAEALLPLFAPRPGARGRAGGRGARRVRPAVQRGLVGRACGPSSACPTTSTRRWSRRWSPSCSTQLQQSHVDYTSFFRSLARPRAATPSRRGVFLDLAAFDAWLERWLALGPDAAGMDRVNPVYIPRNHLVEEALAAATEGDLDPLGRLLDAVTFPMTSAPASSVTPKRPRSISATTRPSAGPDQARAQNTVSPRARNCPRTRSISSIARRRGALQRVRDAELVPLLLPIWWNGRISTRSTTPPDPAAAGSAT